MTFRALYVFEHACVLRVFDKAREKEVVFQFMRNLKCKIKTVACLEYYFLFFLANGAMVLVKRIPSDPLTDRSNYSTHELSD